MRAFKLSPILIIAALVLVGCDAEKMVSDTPQGISHSDTLMSPTQTNVSMIDRLRAVPNFDAFASRLVHESSYIELSVSLHPENEPTPPDDDDPDYPDDWEPVDDDDPFSPPEFMVDSRTMTNSSLEDLRHELNSSSIAQEFFYNNIFEASKSIFDRMWWEDGGVETMGDRFLNFANSMVYYEPGYPDVFLFEEPGSPEDGDETGLPDDWEPVDDGDPSTPPGFMSNGELYTYDTILENQSIRSEFGEDFIDSLIDPDEVEYFLQVHNEVRTLSIEEVKYVFQDLLEVSGDLLLDYIESESDLNKSLSQYMAQNICEPDERDSCFEKERRHFINAVLASISFGTISSVVCFLQPSLDHLLPKVLIARCLSAGAVIGGGTMAIAYGNWNSRYEDCVNSHGEPGCEHEDDEGEGDEEETGTPINGGWGPLPPGPPSGGPLWPNDWPTWFPTTPPPSSGNCSNALKNRPSTERRCGPILETG